LLPAGQGLGIGQSHDFTGCEYRHIAALVRFVGIFEGESDLDQGLCIETTIFKL